MLAEQVDYPLHLGVTEAGTPFAGSIKSSIGLGSLLLDGIGDTIRVSLSADPVEEVKVAWDILKATGLRKRGPNMIACPSCGRADVEIVELAETGGAAPRGVRRRGTSRSRSWAAPSTARARRATPTSASRAAATSGFIYAHGAGAAARCRRTELVEELFAEIDKWIAAGKPRPERGRRKLDLPVMLAQGGPTT